MPKLDLTRFYGTDHPSLYSNRDHMDTIRTSFAAEITACAAECKHNDDLLDALHEAMPACSGLSLPTQLGEGGTRRAFSLPFGLVMKLERYDEPLPAEIKYRGSRSFIELRRRQSTFFEVCAAFGMPEAVSRIYGCLFSFGKYPPNISCVISERLRPLSEMVPASDRLGVAMKDISINRKTGHLKIFDKRFPVSPREAEDVAFADLVDCQESGIWHGNLGLSPQGRVYLLDAGGIRVNWLHLTDSYYPLTLSNNGSVVVDAPLTWQTCSPTSNEHIQQTVRMSSTLLIAYRSKFKTERSDPNGTQPSTDVPAELTMP